MNNTGWIFRSGSNATEEANQSRQKHLAAHKDWASKLEAVNENEWKDEKMIQSLADAHKLLTQAICERVKKDRVYKEDRRRHGRNWRERLEWHKSRL